MDWRAWEPGAGQSLRDTILMLLLWSCFSLPMSSPLTWQTPVHPSGWTTNASFSNPSRDEFSPFSLLCTPRRIYLKWSVRLGWFLRSFLVFNIFWFFWLVSIWDLTLYPHQVFGYRNHWKLESCFPDWWPAWHCVESGLGGVFLSRNVHWILCVQSAACWPLCNSWEDSRHCLRQLCSFAFCK